MCVKMGLQENEIAYWDVVLFMLFKLKEKIINLIISQKIFVYPINIFF
jgi:hypothetical protein